MGIVELLEDLHETLHRCEDSRLRNALLAGIPQQGIRYAGGGLHVTGFKGELTVLCTQRQGFRIQPLTTVSFNGRPLWFEAEATWRVDGFWEVELGTVRRSPEGREIPFTSKAREALMAGLTAALPGWAYRNSAALLPVRDALLRSYAGETIRSLGVVVHSLNHGLEKICSSIAELYVDPDKRDLFHSLRENGLPPWDALDATTALHQE